MNSSNVLQLPSFDHDAEAQILESEPLELDIIEMPEMDFDDQNDTVVPLEFGDDEDHWEPEPKEPPELENVDAIAADAPTDDPNQERLAAAEQLLEELSGASGMLQLEVSARVEEIVQTMTATLFPKLAEDFLAEEISRFLAYAIPKDSLRVDVHVPGPLQDDLSDLVATNRSLRDFCLVHALQPGAEPIVKANWGEGGFEYDLTSLLAACHARTFQNGNGVEDE